MHTDEERKKQFSQGTRIDCKIAKWANKRCGNIHSIHNGVGTLVINKRDIDENTFSYEIQLVPGAIQHREK